MLVKDFQSEVPGTLEELVKLPGVGRKTANVIQSVVFNKAAMAVDTHVSVSVIASDLYLKHVLPL